MNIADANIPTIEITKTLISLFTSLGRLLVVAKADDSISVIVDEIIEVIKIVSAIS